MYLFLDESGDLGFDFEHRNPSRFFAITVLACESRSALQCVRSAVNQTLSRKVNHRSRNKKLELKGRELMPQVKTYFFNKMSRGNNCKIYAVVLDKLNLRLTTNVHEVYNQLASRIFQDLLIPKRCPFVHVTVDKCKCGIAAREFNRCIQCTFEQNLLSSTRITIEHMQSREEAALQAVDMFAYGIFRKYELGDDSWYSIFSSKIAVERVMNRMNDGPWYAIAPQIIESSQ